MNFIKLLLFLGLAGLAYHFWNPRLTPAHFDAADVSPNGFVALPSPTNFNADAVIVLAAANCPKEDARRADELATQLADHKIPYTRATSANFDFPDLQAEIVKRIDAVMRGRLPIVFVKGKAKANPTLDEVLREYGAADN